jgi:trigger factor
LPAENCKQIFVSLPDIYIKNMELIQNKEGLTATLTVKISQEDYAAKVEKELRKIRQTSQVKGFRPGNTPMSLIKKMYGTPLMVEEINKLVTESLNTYEKKNADRILFKVIPSEQNQIFTAYGEQKDFEFVYEAGFYPEFTYQIDTNTEFPYYNIILEDRDVDTEIENYCKMHYIAEYIEAIEDNCLVDANINMVKDGEEVTLNSKFLMTVIPDEHKQVFLNAKLNDTIDVEIRKVFTNEIDLTNMLNVNKDKLESLPETLPFTITKITKETPAQINQDLFDRVVGVDKIHSEEELREYAKNAILTDYETMSLDKLYKDSIEILLEKVNLDMPKTFIEKYVRFLQKENTKASEENFKASVEYFTRESTWKYIMVSLLTQNNAQPTYDMCRDEVKSIIQENYPRYSNQYSDEELNQLIELYMQNEEYMRQLINRVRGKQLALLIKENAKLNVQDVTIEDFQKIYYRNVTNAALNDNAIIEEVVKDATIAEDTVTVITETENQENNNE